MSSRPLRWRVTSRSIKRAISGSLCARLPTGIAIFAGDFAGGAFVWGIMSSGRRRVDLVHTPLVAATLEFSIEPRLHGFYGCVVRHEARGQDENIGIVVLARQLPNLGFPGKRSPNAGVSIGDDVHPNSTPAEQNPSLRLPVRHFLCQRVCVIGIVVGSVRTLSANIIRLVTHFLELGYQPILHFDARMIR